MRRHHTTKDVNNPVVSPYFDVLFNQLSQDCKGQNENTDDPHDGTSYLFVALL